MLSMALYTPLTFATQIVFAPQGNSLASSMGGSSDSVVSLVKFGIVKLDCTEKDPAKNGESNVCNSLQILSTGYGLFQSLTEIFALEAI
jgi:hypothetical protein